MLLSTGIPNRGGPQHRSSSGQARIARPRRAVSPSMAVSVALTMNLLGFHWTKIHDEQLRGLHRRRRPGRPGRGLGRHLTLAGLHYLANPHGDAVRRRRQHRGAGDLSNLGFVPYLADVAYGHADDTDGL